jgi:hypothetical protein
LKINIQFWFNYLLSSGVLYAIAWRLSRRWLYRLESFAFKWLFRLALLAAVVGAVWVVMK